MQEVGQGRAIAFWKSRAFSPRLLAQFALFGSPDPKVGLARGLDLAIQTERMGQMRLPSYDFAFVKFLV
jgi:hypothetical protein